MTRGDCIQRSTEWLAIADAGYKRSEHKALGSAADMCALPTLAATIAQTYATLALSAEAD